MILILSETHDGVTDEVCHWLNSFQANYIRLNENVCNYSLSLSFEKGKTIPILHFNNVNICFSEFSAVWFRRGYFDFNSSLNIAENKEVDTFSKNIIMKDFHAFSEYLYHYLKNNTKCFGNPVKYSVNKLIALETAQKVGLKIPNTIVTENSADFEKLYHANHQKIITKSISDWVSSDLKSYTYYYNTKSVKPEHVSPNFFYSLFQQKVEKIFEVRTFIWDGKTYSAAICVPKDNEKAQTDFRNDYDGIRITPYKLPQDIENKLFKLMKKLDLETGSADFIVDENLNFYFLEINPVGQFGFIDKACNYNLAEKIAKTLIHNNNYEFNP